MNRIVLKAVLLIFVFIGLIALNGCSSDAGEQIFGAATQKVKEKKFAEAVTDFENIIKQNPKSQFAAKSMLELASLYASHAVPNMKRDNDFQKAFEYYSKVYNEFPDSPEGGKACFEIGKYYQSMLAPNLPKEESMRKAITYYNIVVKTYDSIKEAQPALFMIAFIHDNELNEPDSAKIFYTQFVDKYPNSDLAKSAKIELQSLGQKPEDILNQKQEKVN